MQCAINAPSANNRQPWEVRVIRNSEIISKFKEINERAIFNAPAVIVIANDKENRWSPFSIVGLITQNILLAAEAMDLGTCVVGSVPRVLQSEKGRDSRKAGSSGRIRSDHWYLSGNKNERPTLNREKRKELNISTDITTELINKKV